MLQACAGAMRYMGQGLRSDLLQAHLSQVAADKQGSIVDLLKVSWHRMTKRISECSVLHV